MIRNFYLKKNTVQEVYLSNKTNRYYPWDIAPDIFLSTKINLEEYISKVKKTDISRPDLNTEPEIKLIRNEISGNAIVEAKKNIKEFGVIRIKLDNCLTLLNLILHNDFGQHLSYFFSLIDFFWNEISQLYLSLSTLVRVWRPVRSLIELCEYLEQVDAYKNTLLDRIIILHDLMNNLRILFASVMDNKLRIDIRMHNRFLQ